MKRDKERKAKIIALKNKEDEIHRKIQHKLNEKFDGLGYIMPEVPESGLKAITTSLY